MKTNKMITGIAVVIFTAGFIFTTNAQPVGQGLNKPYAGQRFKQDGPMAGNCALLQLTEEQQSKMATLRLNLTEKNLPLRNQLGELRAKKISLQTGDNQDLKAISKIIDEMSAIQAKIMKNAAEHRLEVRSLLTAEQKVMFDARQDRSKMRPANRANRPFRNCRMQ
jgi:Spy/CpxP family protein refolding chaperone